MTDDKQLTEKPRIRLEDYPLAKAYGWRPPRNHKGGILYLYPPRRYEGSAGRCVMSVPPEEYHKPAEHRAGKDYKDRNNYDNCDD